MRDKIYIENPYLKNLKAEIISKEKKDDKYYVILDRTIFYPRNSRTVDIDKGTIADISVVDVFEKNGKIVHVVEEDISSKNVDIEISWNERFDYMQQQTGGNILSVSLNKLCAAQTSDFICKQDYSYITSDFKDLSDSDIRRIEKFANHMIYSNFKITSSVLKENRKNEISICIDNISTSICEGINCSSTGEVGIIKIIDFKRNKQGNIEIKFVCGNRALRDYEFKNDVIDELSKALYVKQTNLVNAVKDILENNKELEEQLKDLKTIKNSNI